MHGHATLDQPILTAGDLEDGLDGFVRSFHDGDASLALTRLCKALNRLRVSLDHAGWMHGVVPRCREHALFRLLHEDPYTARAFAKPRGYAGDAEMLDYIYLGAPPGLTKTARRLLDATTGSVTSRSVLWRKDLIAQEIDETASAVPGARVLAIACGHLREAGTSHALRSGAVAELVALDQDRHSIRRVKRDYTRLPVTPIRASVMDLARGRVELGRFDLVYAAGLYDYLSDAMAAALTARLGEALREGGRLLLGNFAPDNAGRAYMEAFMDWHLVYRDRADMARLAHQVEGRLVELFADPWRNVEYLRVTVHRDRRRAETRDAPTVGERSRGRSAGPRGPAGAAARLPSGRDGFTMSATATDRLHGSLWPPAPPPAHAPSDHNARWPAGLPRRRRGRRAVPTTRSLCAPGALGRREAAPEAHDPEHLLAAHEPPPCPKGAQPGTVRAS